MRSFFRGYVRSSIRASPAASATSSSSLLSEMLWLQSETVSTFASHSPTRLTTASCLVFFFPAFVFLLSPPPPSPVALSVFFSCVAVQCRCRVWAGRRPIPTQTRKGLRSLLRLRLRLLPPRRPEAAVVFRVIVFARSVLRSLFLLIFFPLAAALPMM